MFDYWLDDEVNAVIGHLFHTLLDDMVAILVMDAVKHTVLQLTHQQLLLV
jgi:hypothetical protein